MRKILHPKFLPILVPVASLLGLLLRIWTLGGGHNAAGLYAPQPLAWTLLWIVTAATLALIFAITRRLKNPGRFSDNFPASPLGAAGCALAGLSVIYSCLTTLVSATDLLATLTGILGLVSAAALLLSAVIRYQGKKPHFAIHAIVCLFFALRVFDRCKHWSNLTQTGTFLFQFLASICVMLAAYQLCCFDVNLGNRKSSLFWSLSAVYFCVLALPIGDDPFFYGGMLLWLMTNLCSVRPLIAGKPQEADETSQEASEEAPGEAPDAEPELLSYSEILDQLGKEE